MATLQSLCLLPYTSSRRSCLTLFPCTISRAKYARLPKVSNKIIIEELMLKQESSSNKQINSNTTWSKDEELITKFLDVAEAAADRAEMHAVIGAQRDNWNHLLTHSINLITLTATLMAGIASAMPVAGFKLTSAILFLASTGMMLIVDKIQPSQLAEEQRKATQLWKQLASFLHNTLMLRTPAQFDVEDAMEKVLALDKAYPLPLLPVMLEKFPKNVEPTCWWPKLHRRQGETHQSSTDGEERNGWSKELEEEMVGVLRMLKVKDEEQYVRCGNIVLVIHKALATLGPVLAGTAAVGSTLIGFAPLGAIPAFLAVVGGSLATVVNTLEHAGQLGMLFEMFRNCAGFYRQLQEEIEFNLGENEVEKRVNGELFKLKMALQLGRDLSEFKEFAAYASPSIKDEDIKEFAGRLF